MRIAIFCIKYAEDYHRFSETRENLPQPYQLEVVPISPELMLGKDGPTQPEDVAEPAGGLVKPIFANSCREVVAVVSVAEVGESDAVLDVDGVLVGPGYQRPGAPEDEPVVLHGTPGLDLAHRGGRGGGGRPLAGGPGTPVCGDTPACLGAVAFRRKLSIRLAHSESEIWSERGSQHGADTSSLMS